MNRAHNLWIALICSLVPSLAGAQAAPPAPQARLPELRLSGPHRYENLSLVLIHGPDRYKGASLLTLSEAMSKKQVKVHETQNVGELEIENTGRSPVYVQAGDIVKGGQQDRVLSVDMILPPKSGRVPISSFCVEQGRWNRRGSESSVEFNSSSHQVSGKHLKMATKSRSSQGEVWNKVAETQTKLSKNVGGDVRSNDSGTSLELSLRDSKVKRAKTAYLDALQKVTSSHSDVIGYAFAINGQLNGADVYASSDLFRKLWPKLLDAAAVEAIAEADADKSSKVLELADFERLITVNERAKLEQREAGGKAKLELVTKKSGKDIVFESRDETGWIHRSYLAF